MSWEQCYSKCYGMRECMIAFYYSSTCKLYNPKTIKINKLDSAANKLLAIKRYLENGTCPLTSWASGTVSDLWIENEQLHNNTFIATSNSSITFSRSTFKCENGTKLFQRDVYYVCIGLQLFENPECNDHASAVNMCEQGGWLSITGPRGQEEYDYLYGRKQIYSFSEIWKQYTVFWTDGDNLELIDETIGGYDKMNICEDVNRQNFCAYIAHNECTTGISRAECYCTVFHGYCWRGAACRKGLTQIN
ncbi:hypothetical protein GCK72_003528 [Caenorhabditis remanei]|uniref:PAN-3 domain-containing protein n=1 Tax=Caenorhabditis remanei TaxID=31234 RepID=A0A6A5HWL4_CAERE|nr:hypothetical protein GCK72_003528 [Caenorhabditis remanei]KAF1771701.1 hypothetical protein GCK72_003528 [Caenorhabditis remanei]